MSKGQARSLSSLLGLLGAREEVSAHAGLGEYMSEHDFRGQNNYIRISESEETKTSNGVGEV